LIAGIFDFAGKKKASVDPKLKNRLDELEAKLTILHGSLEEKDKKIEQLSNEISFVNRLLDQSAEK
jgi:chaperonin cofactor prefoldin